MKSISRSPSTVDKRYSRASKCLGFLLLSILAAVRVSGQAVVSNRPTFTFVLPGVQFGVNAVDAQGNTYLAGNTDGANIPTTPGAFQPAFTPRVCTVVMFPIECNAAFVIKLDPSGAIVWATYLDGSYGSSAAGIAVDSSGNVYVAGSTSSADFPVTPGAAITTGAFNGGYLSNGFIAKLNPSGSALVYATLIPGMTPLVLAIDGAGNAYTSGFAAAEFPATSGAFETAPRNASQQYSGAVLKLNTGGSSLVWATFLCGTVPLGNGDEINAIAVNASGNVAVGGFTAAADFPVTQGAIEPVPPSSKSTFVSVLNPTGSALVFSTFLSASNNRSVTVRFDSQGGVYVVGEYGPFPITSDAYLSTPYGFHPFLAHFSAAGALEYASYLPFAIGMDGESMDLDPAGNVLLVGTAGPGLPTSVGAFQPAAVGTFDGYIMKFSPANQLLGATYLGGSGSDNAYTIAAAPNGSVVVGGYTTSPDFPGASSPPAASPGDGFVASLFPALTVQNAADFTSNVIAPGEIVALRGYGLGPVSGAVAQPAADGALPTAWAGVSVQFGGFTAPLFYAQNQQVNVQVPWEITGTSTELAIQYQAGGNTKTIGPVPVPVAASVPGIFSVNNSDGTANSPQNPAKAGSFISLYGTGGGLAAPIGITGGFWPEALPLPLLTLPVATTINGENATVQYAGASPLSPSGVFQMNVILPADLPSSTAARLTVQIGTGASSMVTIPVAIQ